MNILTKAIFSLIFSRFLFSYKIKTQTNYNIKNRLRLFQWDDREINWKELNLQDIFEHNKIKFEKERLELNKKIEIERLKMETERLKTEIERFKTMGIDRFKMEKERLEMNREIEIERLKMEIERLKTEIERFKTMGIERLEIDREIEMGRIKIALERIKMENENDRIRTLGYVISAFIISFGLVNQGLGTHKAIHNTLVAFRELNDAVQKIKNLYRLNLIVDSFFTALKWMFGIKRIFNF